jgi:hypothetical protein
MIMAGLLAAALACYVLVLFQLAAGSWPTRLLLTVARPVTGGWTARIRRSRTLSRGALRCSQGRTSCSASFAVQPCRELGAGAWPWSEGLAA